MTAVDNTFATPILQRPLDLGADVVVHSATKFLAGHSDVLLGMALTSNEELYKAMLHHRITNGAIPGPVEAWLGLRGLRTLRAHMDVLEGQLKALAAADPATDANLWVMAPMVADQHEADYFVKLGKSFGLKFVGAMAEVPSIALMADKVADVADFVSIGTNDLTQYTLAADRTLGSVANYQTAWHPAVLRAIKMICDAGNAKGMPVGVCGEAAADPDLAVVLAGLGVNSLSMTPVALDDVRASLAEVTFEEAQARAEAALNGDFYHPAN